MENVIIGIVLTVCFIAPAVLAIWKGVTARYRIRREMLEAGKYNEGGK